MTRWEYRLLVWTPPTRVPAVPVDEAVTKLLNRNGANGWLLSSFIPPASGRSSWTFAFVRPAETTITEPNRSETS